mmetsp:Transcript_40664/g.102944  ORF Transcript_40664/g.102944 Transcript_40664/m.102944 type:complete len:272 (+) Transcript_40664:268-1083(+)
MSRHHLLALLCRPVLLRNWLDQLVSGGGAGGAGQWGAGHLPPLPQHRLLHKRHRDGAPQHHQRAHCLRVRGLLLQRRAGHRHGDALRHRLHRARVQHLQPARLQLRRPHLPAHQGLPRPWQLLRVPERARLGGPRLLWRLVWLPHRALRPLRALSPPLWRQLRLWLRLLRRRLRHRVALRVGRLRDQLEHLGVRQRLLVHAVRGGAGCRVHPLPGRLCAGALQRPRVRAPPAAQCAPRGQPVPATLHAAVLPAAAPAGRPAVPATPAGVAS